MAVDECALGELTGRPDNPFQAGAENNHFCIPQAPCGGRVLTEKLDVDADPLKTLKMKFNPG